MMDRTDPLFRMAKQRIVKVSADLEVQIAAVPGGGPCVEILRRLQDRAAESLAVLATADFTQVKEIVALQNEVKRYDEWLGWMRDIIHEGKAYDRQFTEDDRKELLDMLMGSEEGMQQAVELGLIDDIPRDA